MQRDKLHQYSKRIQAVLNREKELAKEALSRGDKQRALLILRRRKYQEQVLAKADQQLETLEQLVPLHRWLIERLKLRLLTENRPVR